MPTVDFTNVEVKDFEPIPTGLYPVVVVEAEIRTGQESGQPYMALTYEVMADVEEYAGRKLFDNLSFSAKALWKMKGFLVNGLGYADEDIAGEVDIEPADFIGSQLAVKVGQKPDMNDPTTMRNTVKSYMTIAVYANGGEEPTPAAV